MHTLTKSIENGSINSFSSSAYCSVFLDFAGKCADCMQSVLCKMCVPRKKTKTIKARKVRDGKLCGHSAVLKWSLN